MKMLLIYNARLVDRDTDEPGAVLCDGSKIAAVFKGDFSDEKRALEVAKAFCSAGWTAGCTSDCPSGAGIETFDASSLILTPAFIDTHVHLRDPGLTQKEDLQSGLTACASGGYGTVVAMPNTSPVMSSPELAEQTMERGNALGLTKMFQTVSITRNFEGEDISHLDNLSREKIPFITEDGHDVLSGATMLRGMKKASENRQVVSCHCEDCTLALEAKPHRQKALALMKEHGLSAWGGGDTSNVPENALYQIDSELTEANSILALAEDVATERNIRLAKKASCHVHICHISTAESIEAVRRAKNEMVSSSKVQDYSSLMDILDSFSVTAEVTPHHIALSGAEEPLIRALVNPPLRTESDRKSVIKALREGVIDCIATDHAPHTAEDKAVGAPGFTGIEAAYGVCHSVLVKEEGFSESELSALMSANPARILKLNKGLLKAGFDADLTLCSPEEKWTVRPELFKSKGKATPFEGQELTGKVKGIILRGKKL